jgi:membrane-associated PAP2 superfamily phosphatase
MGVVLITLLVVPVIKRYSQTSCPWDLTEFGGTAAYVPHWVRGLTDGGPGHCFPSGHAVSAFGFFGLYFLWRDHDPRRAHAALLAVSVLGLLLGTAQIARGAHHLSHVLWSAWLCWTVACAAAAVQLARRAAIGRGRSPAGITRGIG